MTKILQILRGLALVVLATPLAASAGLGGYASKVSSGSSSDSSALKAEKVSRKAAALYTVEELDTGGILVREYANSDGIVFAVTWKGIGTPDLQTLLGSYYSEYAAAQAQAVKDSTTRRHQSIQTPHIVVRRAGHMRAWRGRAAVASLIPSGVNAETLP